MEDIESHRIPQDVTGFQFKIIGDMTVKQFAYLAGPIFLAWIFFQLPISLFIKLPLSLLSAGLGASLAFLPIGGRPMDVMIGNFIKALFNPTLFVYQKGEGRLRLSAVPLSFQKTNVQKEKAQEVLVNGTLSTLRVSTKTQGTKFDEEEATPLSPIPPQDLSSPKSQTIRTTVRGLSPTPRIISMQNVLEKPTPQPTLEKKIQEEADEALKKKVVALEKDLEMARKDMATLQQKQVIPTFSPPKVTLGLENQLQTLLVQKEQLTKQLVTLQQNLDLKKKNVFTPTIAKSDLAMAKPLTQNVRQIPKGVGKSVGLPIVPQSPNIVTGIIEDPRGNPIANILVEVKDNEGNPVRAFKTNGLGQFASATPLKNGVYTISFEDPKGQNKFDAIGFSVKGEVILPIEVLSIDTREELRKSLFQEK